MPQHSMHDDVERVLLSQDQIQERIKALGEEITRDYSGRSPHLVTILKGSIPFLADLIRAMNCPLSLDVMAVASYAGHQSSGAVRLTKDLDDSIEGRHVLVVEDIIDTGLTLTYLQEILRARAPRRIRTACLLSKPSRRKVNVPIDYVGFSIEDQFVVGYGLDYNERWRGLPYIAVVS